MMRERIGNRRRWKGERGERGYVRGRRGERKRQYRDGLTRYMCCDYTGKKKLKHVGKLVKRECLLEGIRKATNAKERA